MIVIPMAGESKRFYDKGYKLPKYMLPIGKKTLFERCLFSFKRYFKTDTFIFILRNNIDNKIIKFIEQKIIKIGILEYDIVILENNTRGQAETVFQGLKNIYTNEELIIFNIDTIRHNFTKPTYNEDIKGYIEVFEGSGDIWSFVKPGIDNKVLYTTEKVRVSNLCSTGLYQFRKKEYFLETYNHFITLDKDKWDGGELYVAPLYNFLINKGMTIKYNLINSNLLDFSGTPEQYTHLLNKYIS